jgi:hypothetical protein
LCPADVGVTVNLDLLDGWRAEQESTLNTNTVGSDTANGEVLLIAAIPQTNNGSAYKLNTIPLAFNDTKVNRYIVTRPQLGQIFVDRLVERL